MVEKDLRDCVWTSGMGKLRLGTCLRQVALEFCAILDVNRCPRLNIPALLAGCLIRQRTMRQNSGSTRDVVPDVFAKNVRDHRRPTFAFHFGMVERDR